MRSISRPRMGKVWAACTYTKTWATGGDNLKERETDGEGQNDGDSWAPTGIPARVGPERTRGTAFHEGRAPLPERDKNK